MARRTSRPICDCDRVHAMPFDARTARDRGREDAVDGWMGDRSRGLTFGCVHNLPTRTQVRRDAIALLRTSRTRNPGTAAVCPVRVCARDERSIALTDDEARVRVNNPKTDRSRACFV